MRPNWLSLHGSGVEEAPWALFHENSKTSELDMLATGQLSATKGSPSEPLGFHDYPSVALPDNLSPLDLSVGHAIQLRFTPRELERVAIPLQDLSTILYCAYGVSRDPSETDWQRPLHTVPSAGAAYPLELFFYSRSIEGLSPGLYYYNSVEHHVVRLREGDHTAKIASFLVNKAHSVGASIVLFVGAMLQKSISKYGDRGYRFALLEAGHLGQNVSLCCTALSLGCIHIGGYFDSKLDDWLGLDGMFQSAVYVIAIGGIPNLNRAEDS
ncbi:MAG: SagB/ThcOx family dehydrogenase [Bryobacteraceae bacterium]|nr:SagB/ThcOx family dehydrogenase [Bryobacteraceae bacterium]